MAKQKHYAKCEKVKSYFLTGLSDFIELWGAVASVVRFGKPLGNKSQSGLGGYFLILARVGNLITKN